MLNLSNVISEFCAAVTIIIIDLKIILYIIFRHIYGLFSLEISYAYACHAQKERNFFRVTTMVHIFRISVTIRDSRT
jgi:hypothetical protein